MRFGRRVALAFWVLALSSAATATGVEAQEIEGCWYFSQDADARALGLPWGVRFTSDLLTGWPGLADERDVRVAVTLEGRSATTNRPFGYWQPLGGDSVRVGYPGLTGVMLRLGREGRWLQGTATSTSRAGPDPGSDPVVRLMRGQCPEGA